MIPTRYYVTTTYDLLLIQNLRLDLSNREYEDSTPLLYNKKIILPDLDPDTRVKIIKSANDIRQDKTMIVITPEHIIGQSFLSNPTNNDTIDNGARCRAFIVKLIEYHDNKMAKDPGRNKFLCSFNDDQYQEILAYNGIIRHIEKDHDDLDIWKFKRITVHAGPILSHHHNYK